MIYEINYTGKDENENFGHQCYKIILEGETYYCIRTSYGSCNIHSASNPGYYVYEYAVINYDSMFEQIINKCINSDYFQLLPIFDRFIQYFSSWTFTELIDCSREKKEKLSKHMVNILTANIKNQYGEQQIESFPGYMNDNYSRDEIYNILVDIGYFGKIIRTIDDNLSAKFNISFRPCEPYNH